MPDYQVSPDQPDYQVPSVVDAASDACPKCGSHAILPSFELLNNGIPRQLRIYQCARCGTRYRIRPKMLTWRDLSRDVTIIIGFIVFVLVVLMLLL